MKSIQNKGFTLIELMVAMVVASIVMGAVITTYQLQVRGKNTQEALTDLNQGARVALAVMAREIRTAGCDPDETSGATITTAGNNQIVFSRDNINTAGTSFEPDGLLDGPNEQITYTLYTDSDGNQNLGRNVGGGNQPLVRNVDALDFVYLDGAGNPTANIIDIRRVEITIVARAGENRAGSITPGFIGGVMDTRSYTNQQGNEILAPPNDKFRRLLLTTTVNLVNFW